MCYNIIIMNMQFDYKNNLENLIKNLPAEICTTNKDMKDVCAMKVGGHADLFVEPTTVEQIILTIKKAKENNIPYYVIGNASNTIIKDGGIAGVVISICDSFSHMDIVGNIVTAKSGTSLIKLATLATKQGLGGLEFAGGIPGSVGGGVFMNAGAYDGQISDVITSAKVFDGENVITLNNKDMMFEYRKSIFSDQKNYVVLEATFTLTAGTGDIKKLQEFNNRRKEKQPLDLPNCGSTFKRPEGNYAGKLIEEAGLTGFSIGGAQVSTKHCGFVVNKGYATAKDVLDLMNHIKRVVYENSGIMLESEWVIIGETSRTGVI